jgi:hypothetical protein
MYMITHTQKKKKKLRRQQAEVIQNYENEHVHGIGQAKDRHIKYKRLKLGGSET